MGNDYPTVRACGLKGRVCDLSSYPACDRHSMVGVSKLPGDPPQDPNAQKQWVDGWVGTVHSYAGICKLPAGRWGVYYGRRGSAPLIPVTSELTPEPTPEAIPETTPEPVPAPEAAATPEATPDAGVAQAAGPNMPISVGSPDPEGSSSFSMMGFIRSVQEFGEGLIPKEKQEEYGIYGAVGVGAIAFLVGAFALVRRIAKRARSKPKAAKVAPPPVPEVQIKADADIVFREHATEIQRMLALHQRFMEMEWYDGLDRPERMLALKAIRKMDSEALRKIAPGVEMGIGNAGRVTFEDARSELIFNVVELDDERKVQRIEEEYRGIVEQIINLKKLEHSSSELMRTIDEEVLARALLLEKHMMISEGGWREVEKAYTPGEFSLKGPLPPEWITKRATETNWGVEGRGDPLGPIFDPNLRPTPVPPPLPTPPQEKPIPLGRDMKKTSVGEFSSHFAQLLTVEGYGDLDQDTQRIILEEQELFQKAIDIALEDEGFRERHIDATKKTIKPAGLVMVLNEILSKRGIDILGRGFSGRVLRREIRRGRKDKWVGRLHERVIENARRHGK